MGSLYTLVVLVTDFNFNNVITTFKSRQNWNDYSFTLKFKCTKWVTEFWRLKGLVSNSLSRLYAVYMWKRKVMPQHFFLVSSCWLWMEQRPSDSRVTSPSIILHLTVMICQRDSGTGTLAVSQSKHNPLSYANSHKDWDDTRLKESPVGFRSRKFAHLWELYPARWNLLFSVCYSCCQEPRTLQDSRTTKWRKMRRKLKKCSPLHESRAFQGLPGVNAMGKARGDFPECHKVRMDSGLK